MAALAIIGHSSKLICTLYAAIEEEYPVMDTFDHPLYSEGSEERITYLAELVEMLIGNTPVPEEFTESINEMLGLFDNEMLVERIFKGEVSSLILKDNGFFLAELRSEHAA